MKNIISEISQQEKNRILEMHKKATSNQYLMEEDENAMMENPFRIRMINSQGLGKEINATKGQYGYEVNDLNICDFFDVKEQGPGKDVYKTKVQLTNMTKTAVRVVDADVRSIDLDIYPAPNNKLLGPGQQISFDIELTPGSLKGDQVAFEVVYEGTSAMKNKTYMVFFIKNNIDECGVA